MNTIILEAKNREALTKEYFKEAGKIIRAGGLVAFPTETVYGLGGDALNPESSKKIYSAKGRPSDNPLIVHIADMDGLYEVAEEIGENALRLAEAYWPGPMTLVLKKKAIVPDETTGGLSTVAVRMPSDPAALRFIEACGVPVAGPSANTSGRPSPTSAQHVIEDLDGRIEMIIDAGNTEIGLESTIIDVTGDIPVLLRPGAITLDMIKAAAGGVEIDPAILGPVSPDIRPKAPGMKYRHYAPKAAMTIYAGENAAVAAEINRQAAAAVSAGKKAGVLATAENADKYNCGDVRIIGSQHDQEQIAHNLFSVLRDFDADGVDVIFSESFGKDGIGAAIMNRLSKAAGYNIVEVG